MLTFSSKQSTLVVCSFAVGGHSKIVGIIIGENMQLLPGVCFLAVGCYNQGGDSLLGGKQPFDLFACTLLQLAVTKRELTYSWEKNMKVPRAWKKGRWGYGEFLLCCMLFLRV